MPTTETSYLSVWLMTSLAPLVIILYSLSLAENNHSADVLAQPSNALPSTSVMVNVKAYVDLCTWWYGRHDPITFMHYTHLY